MPTSPTSTHASTHTPPRSAGRAMARARNELLTQLKDDHQRVKKAYARFRKLDADEDAEQRSDLILQVLDELSLHAQLEEELLYPAARESIADPLLIDEAEVEHEMLHLLMDLLRKGSPGQPHEQHAARFTVLCEYTLHHVKEEEREMFPQLVKAKLDWVALAREFEERRAALDPSAQQGGDGSEGRALPSDVTASRKDMETTQGLGSRR